jgi:hypothetical protein
MAGVLKNQGEGRSEKKPPGFLRAALETEMDAFQKL